MSLWKGLCALFGYMPPTAYPIAHTRVETINGVTHVQRFGPEHVVEGSERIIDVPDGSVVVIRHVVVA